jgi:hypothetical protein
MTVYAGLTAPFASPGADEAGNAAAGQDGASHQEVGYEDQSRLG